MREKKVISAINQRYIVAYRTTDIITEAFGKIFLDLDFTQMAGSSELKSTATIISEGLTFTQELHDNKCTFDLSWMKYFAPQSATRDVSVVVKMNNVVVTTIAYTLTAGRGEVEVLPNVVDFFGEKLKMADCFHIGATQRTKHFSDIELLTKYNASDYLVVYVGNGHTETEVETNQFISIEHLQGGYDGEFQIILVRDKDNAVVHSKKLQDVTCADVELRITNKHGLRGAIGGKIIANKTEGGDEQKTHADFTPIAGVWKYGRTTAEVKVDVAFYFDGDADLLELLRDGCVYGQVEWYCEQSGEWLPCLIEDNGIDSNDAYAEHIVTIKLQDL